MGEEAKQAEAKAEAKPEEKKEEKAEEKKEEPKPPLPFLLFVDLHCMGCAKKIEKSILNIRGVEEVVIDMLLNQVTIKGVVEPEAVCTKIMKKTKRRAQVLSPLPATDGDPMPEVVASQVSGSTTVELNVNMHCEACAVQLERKILKMKGVRTAETDLSSGKVIVTGTMDANNLVDYVYRRTKKQAKIVPQPQPEQPKGAEAKPEEKKEEQKPDEELKPEARKEEAAKMKDGAEKSPEEENNNGGDDGNNGENKAKEEKSTGHKNKEEANKEGDEQTMQKMMYYNYEPLYVFEKIPPPQLFSDENPNACCIT